MPKTTQVFVKDLSLDLSNYRTVPQRTEAQAVQTMIKMKPDRFWALTESLIDDGYLATENILVLRNGKSKLIVKEGNRRIAALKLIHELLPLKNYDVPVDIQEKIQQISAAWKRNNQKVPCTVYEDNDEAKVEDIVKLVHGKGNQASRDQWNAIARARYNRDVAKVSEPALDLLEKYIKVGKNITEQEKELWSGEYPLTVLLDAIKRIAGRFTGIANTSELIAKYPSIANRDGLERLISDIGNKNVTFETIRNKHADFGTSYGLSLIEKPAVSSSGVSSSPTASTPTSGASPTPTDSTPSSSASSSSANSTPTSDASSSQTDPTPTSTPIYGKSTAVAINDPESVRRALKRFTVLGNNRDKVVTLKNEAVIININKTPLAFCFLVRSMFEVSAKAYCLDHEANGGPKSLKADNTDRQLAHLLDDIYKHLITLSNGKIDTAKQRILHGSIVEITKTNGILSVTSMNQLIHSTTFSLAPSDICIVFGNIYPLLVEMNQ